MKAPTPALGQPPAAEAPWSIASGPPSSGLLPSPLHSSALASADGVLSMGEDMTGLSFDIEEDVGLFDPEVLEMMLAQTS
ncbi:hypothetical protein WJX84_000048 [Apatococcus fuscideae]|uniref:Uncharacterized protein n=1 Tax=Apatococcus fuscideae TaxID=2026836 RepID=A0AAW1T0D8_9CHLO